MVGSGGLMPIGMALVGPTVLLDGRAKLLDLGNCLPSAHLLLSATGPGREGVTRPATTKFTYKRTKSGLIQPS
jgi:hypothetical protein